MKDKEIRFIDSRYNELFRIPDGDAVRIILSGGDVMERNCKYIDDYHFELLRKGRDYGDVFHICQFAELNERSGNTYEPVFKNAYELDATGEDEKELVYRSSDKSDRGCVGWLRIDFGSSGESFYSTWNDESMAYKTPEFRSELDEVINHFRLRSETPLLKNRASMSEVCRTTKSLELTGGWTDMYMFKVQTDKHTYFMRCSPAKGDYNAYVYCYDTEKLQQYKDVKFIENTYGDISDDKFFKTDSGFLEIYYNPDASSGGQLVMVSYTENDIKDAAKHSRKQDEFFERLSGNGRTELVDAGTDDFRRSISEFMRVSGDFEGCNKRTMNGMMKAVGIKPKSKEEER